MIRNHGGGGNAIKDTAKLIETLKKVGVIKSKKKHVKKTLAADEIRQNNEMVGYGSVATPQAAALSVMRNVPLLMNQLQSQGGFNQAQIEDIKRGVGQDLAVIKDALEEDKRSRDQQYGMLAYGTGALARQVKQLTEKARPEPMVEEPEAELQGDITLDIDESTMERQGPNVVVEQNTPEDTNVAPEEIFAETEEEEANAPFAGALPPPEVKPPQLEAPAQAQARRKRFEQGAINVAMDEGGWRELTEINRMKTVELNDLLSKMEISGYRIRDEYKSKEYSPADKRDIIWRLLEQRGKQLIAQGQRPKKQVRVGK